MRLTTALRQQRLGDFSGPMTERRITPWREAREKLAQIFEEPQVGLTLILVSVLIVLQDRYGWQQTFFDLVARSAFLDSVPKQQLSLLAQGYYSLSCLLFYVLIPAIYARLLPLPISNPFGLGIAKSRSYLPLYSTLAVLMVPLVWLLAGSHSFGEYYPLYDPSSIQGWFLYEALRFAALFAIEFFFRGFLLFRLEHTFRNQAVLIMLIPYSFIHIHKPLPEALGSIAAGLVLGVLALMSRSIWPGLLLHFAAAFFMDLAALVRSRRLAEL